MDARLLMIDDDRKLQKLVREYLESYDYMFHSLYSGTGDQVERALREHGPDLVILDIMVPGKDGLEILRDLRRDPLGRRLPVLMLTARGDETDRIVGLELGADDYLAKPFNPRELLARIRAILRRTRDASGDGGQARKFDAGQARGPDARATNEAAAPSGDAGKAPGILRSGEIELNRAKMVCRAGKTELDLSSAEFQLLAVLLEAPGVVLSRDELMNRTKGRDY
ncbi:MAG: response regulator, partial [Leptospirales bacterium]